MGDLKYAILGVIKRKPISGYEITKILQQNVSKVFEANHSQVYPMLRRLAEDGLIDFKIETIGEKLEKKMYSITPKGDDDLLQWLSLDEPLDVPAKDSFRLRMYYMRNIPSAKRDQILNAQIEKLRERLGILREALSQYGDEPPNLDTDELADYLLLMGGIYRDRAYIEWVEHCIGVIKSREKI